VEKLKNKWKNIRNSKMDQDNISYIGLGIVGLAGLAGMIYGTKEAWDELEKGHITPLIAFSLPVGGGLVAASFTTACIAFPPLAISYAIIGYKICHI
jgi:hypothetical protein